MTLSADQLAQVRELLKECSAQVLSGDNDSSRGSGFFIDEQLLLTCGHVVEVEEGEKVTVHPFNRESLEGEVLKRLPDKKVDLALIRTETRGEEARQPSVLLDAKAGDNVDYYAVGYPRETVLGAAGLEEIAYTGRKRLSSGGDTELLVLDAGRGTIMHALSGGAVLNPHTGAVVALVQYSEAQSGSEGGAAIPIARAAHHFKEVKTYLANPPASTDRWRRAIGEEAWRDLGKPSNDQAQVDLFLDGDNNTWNVRIDGEDAHCLTARDLPSEISEALFHWAQRRRVRDAADVRLLGRLLAGAVFPTDVASTLQRRCGADELLIRLHIDPQSDLFDIPWELATLTVDEEDSHVGAHERLGLARVVERSAQASSPREGGARVVAAVMQPANLQEKMPTLTFGAKQVPWPREGEIGSTLTGAILPTVLEANIMENPAPNTLRSALTAPPPQGMANAIVHYIGSGQIQDGQPCLALSDDEGDIVWRGIDEVCEWVGSSGARLLIVELTLPQVGAEVETIPPRTFLQGFAGKVEAVLFTRFPLHPRLLSAFNSVLYRRIGAGHTIESAVQIARNETYINRFFGDATEFGWFTLVTGAAAGMQIVRGKPEAGGGVTTSTVRERAPSEEAAPAPEEPPVRVAFGESR